MNIVYELTNLSTGKKYIGHKNECRIEIIDGLSTIINAKTELPYYGSSSNIEMKLALSTDKFSAKILEVVLDKKEICKREQYWMDLCDAVNSAEYYNLSNVLEYNKRDFQNSVRNIYGETYKEYASNEGSLVKRINSAKKIGFESLEAFYIDIATKIHKQTNLAQVSRDYGLERHTIARLLADVNIFKFEREIKTYSTRLKGKIEDYRINGASVKKIASMMSLEFATVLYYIGTDKIKDKNYLVSKRKGLTEDELGYKIMELFLQNRSIKEINKILNLNKEQATRTFHRFIRKHIEINDFNGILK